VNVPAHGEDSGKLSARRISGPFQHESWACGLPTRAPVTWGVITIRSVDLFFWLSMPVRLFRQGISLIPASA